MKPLIGLCANYSSDDKIGLQTEQGMADQKWQILADDYVVSIEKAGGLPVIIPIFETHENLNRIIDLLDGIIFTGGSDIDPFYYGDSPQQGLRTIEPYRDYHEVELAKRILYKTNIPVLGICRGIQLLNVAAGGTLYQSINDSKSKFFNHSVLNSPKYYPVHEAIIKEGSKIHSIFKKTSIRVNSFNHQAVKKTGKDFIATMTAPDGLIEGIEFAGDRFIVAVQWHPEAMVSYYPEHLELFKVFVEEALNSEAKHK